MSATTKLSTTLVERRSKSEGIMSTQPQRPAHTITQAWDAFCETDEFKKVLRKAVEIWYDEDRLIGPIERKRHAKDAMWLAFTKGIEIGPHISPPVEPAPEAPVTPQECPFTSEQLRDAGRHCSHFPPAKEVIDKVADWLEKLARPRVAREQIALIIKGRTYSPIRDAETTDEIIKLLED